MRSPTPWRSLRSWQCLRTRPETSHGNHRQNSKTQQLRDTCAVSRDACTVRLKNWPIGVRYASSDRTSALLADRSSNRNAPWGGCHRSLPMAGRPEVATYSGVDRSTNALRASLSRFPPTPKTHSAAHRRTSRCCDLRLTPEGGQAIFLPKAPARAGTTLDIRARRRGRARPDPNRSVTAGHRATHCSQATLHLNRWPPLAL